MVRRNPSATLLTRLVDILHFLNLFDSVLQGDQGVRRWACRRRSGAGANGRTVGSPGVGARGRWKSLAEKWLEKTRVKSGFVFPILFPRGDIGKISPYPRVVKVTTEKYIHPNKSLQFMVCGIIWLSVTGTLDSLSWYG